MGIPPKTFHPSVFDLFVLQIVKEHGPISDAALFEIAKNSMTSDTLDARKMVYKTLHCLVYQGFCHYVGDWEYEALNLL